jgi:hypothetical protein
MKRIGIVVLTLAFFGFGLSSLKLSDEDREKAIAHLKETKENMMSTSEGLSDEQLQYKASPESWSIAECVEHLAISENAIFEMVPGAVQETADMSRRSEVTMSDEQLLDMITSRAQKVKTSEAFEPSGKFGDFEETLEAFTDKREENIAYVENTEDDLRNHYAELPFGTVDAYQVILFMSGHTARHTKQIEEIKEDPGFPEN